jgi:hypothetical protein
MKYNNNKYHVSHNDECLIDIYADDPRLKIINRIDDYIFTHPNFDSEDFIQRVKLNLKYSGKISGEQYQILEKIYNKIKDIR